MIRTSTNGTLKLMAEQAQNEDTSLYHRHFYDARRSASRRSAEVILPLVFDLVAPRSIIDVGCATGGWLAVAASLGVTDLLGVDLTRVPEDLMEIAHDHFVMHDLRQPLDLSRTFDLVLALEVAEHLPAACSDTFLNSLVRLGPVVLFSAAIPHQGGTGHVNERWQDYWIDKFSQRQYSALDFLRSRLWHDDRVWPHYAQNTFIFVSDSYLSNHATLRGAATQSQLPPRVVHPTVYLATQTRLSRIVARTLVTSQ